jgi:hypothetical protein
VIGRPVTGEHVDLNLADDPAVSRAHARIFFAEGAIWVEDLGSTNGTLVNRRRLAARAPERIKLSDRLEVGDTTLVIGTDRLVHLRCGPLSVLLESLPVYGHAFHHCAIPLISGITAWNLSTSVKTSADLSVTIPGFGDQCVFSLDRLAPGERRLLDPPAALVHAQRLESISACTPATIEFVLSGGDRAMHPLRLLSSWEWPHLGAARKVIAAYVLPDDPAVRRAIRETGQPGEGADVLCAAATGDPEAMQAAVCALYENLARGGDIRYAKPMIQTDVESGLTYQLVHSPDMIRSPVASALREANCLDLSLFLAGCLENLEVPPLIILAGERPEFPDHALVGFWRDGSPRFRPLLNRESLVAALQTGELRILESTGVCVGEQRLAFDAALANAERCLATSPFVHAVDIMACRLPSGRINPLQLGLDPIVAHAYREAELCLDRLGASQLETSHLLRGILLAGGALTLKLFSDYPGGIPAALGKLDSQGRGPDRSGSGTLETEPTLNYGRCQEDAVRNAKNAGSSRVRESDLLWALLSSGSRELDVYLKEIGIARDTLCDRLRLLVPPSIAATRPYQIPDD